MDYVEHPLIEPESIEARIYQQVLLDSARKGNTLVVLPTGLGKTQVAIMLAAHRFSNNPESKFLMMAPTRPLVTQHKETFEKTIDFPNDNFNVLTGRTRPDDRKHVWDDGKMFFATPQTVERDIITQRLSLNDFSLLVFDEAHRAVGDYPYGFIAERYEEMVEDTLILGLTASPGSSSNRIENVKENLYIEQVEARSEDHPNVKPYVQPVDVEREMLELPEPVAKIKNFLEKQLKDHLKKLKNMNFLDSIQNVGKGKLLEVQKKIKKGQKEKGPNPPPRFFKGMMHQAAAFRLSHCIELLESQGLESLKDYLDRMQRKSRQSGASKSLKQLLKDSRMEKVIRLVENSAGRVENPKLERAKEIVSKQLSENPGSRIMMFAHYRNSVDRLVGELKDIKDARPHRFIGQADRKDQDGFTQKEQARVIERFRDGDVNILVSTSVGEEGLDIPGVDLAVFYEPVPSEIRSIQRRGRTGRESPGRVIVLLMKGTRDEAFYWSAVHKEKKMRENLKKMGRDNGKDNQKSIDDFGDD